MRGIFKASIFASLVCSGVAIIGGQVVEDGDWPWQVSVQHRTCVDAECTWTHMCGGSIIDRKWVVTAAHCIEESHTRYNTDKNNPGDKWAVVIGMNKLNYNHEENNFRNDGKRFLLKRIITHPTYVFMEIFHADVALLRLRDAMEYADDVQPISLPNGKEPAHGELCHITGWGYKSSRELRLSHDLRHATIPIVNFEQCRKTGHWYKLLEEANHMCGGDVAHSGIGMCGGDSGGPLSCQDATTGLYYLAGVSSFGFSDCGKRGHLEIFVKITTFESWIQKTIDENDQGTKSEFDNAEEAVFEGNLNNRRFVEQENFIRRELSLFNMLPEERQLEQVFDLCFKIEHNIIGEFEKRIARHNKLG